MVFNNGDVYEGDFKGGKFNGKGDFIGHDNYKYTGDWVDNK